MSIDNIADLETWYRQNLPSKSDFMRFLNSSTNVRYDFYRSLEGKYHEHKTDNLIKKWSIQNYEIY